MERKLTVSELNSYIKGVFDDELILQNITVLGEIFEFSISGGNSYVVLKDGECTLSCVFFSSAVRYEIGQRVAASGAVRFYPKGGRVTFVINRLQILGRGELLAALENAKKQLSAEGVFSNRRVLPQFVRRVALLTGAGGAVVHDFLQCLSDVPYVEVKLFSVRVQGAGAAQEIATQLKRIYSLEEGAFDAVVIARGGGSHTDLGEFNDATLARVVHQSPFVVLSAVGHETDYTLCDFAADIRTGTPSMAGALIVQNNAAFLERFFAAARLSAAGAERILSRSLNDLRRKSTGVFDAALRKNQRVFSSVVRHSLSNQSRAEAILHKKRRQLNVGAANCKRAIFAKVDGYEGRLKLLSAAAEGHNPRRILSRGYARILQGGSAISGVGGLKKGEIITVEMADGRAETTVNSSHVYKPIKKR